MVETRSQSNTIPSGEQRDIEMAEEASGHTGESIPPPTDPEDVGEDDGDDPDGEFERLRQQIIKKRRREAIASIRMKLAEEISANLIKIDSLLPIYYKRITSSISLDPPPTNRVFRPSTPPEFHVKNLKEISKYEAG